MASDLLYLLWQRSIPRDLFDILFMISGRNDFVGAFMQSLKDRTNEQFLEDFLTTSSYSDVYIANAEKSDLKGKDLEIMETFGRKQLEEVSGKLDVFKKKLSENSNEQVAALYQYRVEEVKRLILLRKHLHTMEFTKQQCDSEMWHELLDWNLSASTGECCFPFEHIARELLERTSVKDHRVMPMRELIETLHLSEREMTMLGTISGNCLSFEQTRVFFELMLQRLELGDTWSVVGIPTLAAITVNAKARTVMIPESIEMFPDEILYVSAHEMIHVLRGENGYHQPIRIGLEGVGDYMVTEEGLATTVEVLKGQSIAHPRRRLLAARYLAISMAVKSKNGKKRYSYQDIFDELVRLEVSEDTAAKLLWRIARGTSMRQLVSDLSIDHGDFHLTLPVAECFVKDIVYFHGQLKVLRWLAVEVASINEIEQFDWLKRMSSSDQRRWYLSLDDLMKAEVFVQGADPDVVKELINRVLPTKLDLRYFYDKDYKNLWNRDEGFVSVNGLF